jgi:uncharacterized membrane protein YhaH (DUF805 family)
MFCRNCGAEAQNNAVVCTKCGVLMGDGTNYCPNCGFQPDPKAVICVNCGCELKPIFGKNIHQSTPTLLKTNNENIVNENVFTMKQAINSCFRKYADFTGRACRAEYWYWSLFLLLMGILFVFLLNGVADMIYDNDTYDVFYNAVLIISAIANLAFFLPTLAVSVRRLHDIGRSGWEYLIGLIPLVGCLVLIVWFAIDSEDDNQYGTSPKK